LSVPDPYVPKRGDIIKVDFGWKPVGHEQAFRRPALVLSRYSYNQRVGLCVVCPITEEIKGYPFEVDLDSAVQLDECPRVEGVVLADQVKNIDWRVRKARYVNEVDEAFMKTVLAKINLLLTTD
jgi:mRNA interferase MazF